MRLLLRLIALGVIVLGVEWVAGVLLTPHMPLPSPRVLNAADAPLDLSGAFGLEFCPLSLGNVQEAACHSIGTVGPVKLISWNSDLRSLLGQPVVEASLRFDERGRLIEECHRGHIDFQAGSCGRGWTQQEKQRNLFEPWGVEFDSRGRVVRSRNLSGGAGTASSCTYDDASRPTSSTCNDGTSIETYRYADNGRRLSFSRRRIPQPDDDPARAAELEHAYAVDTSYTYSDDSRGNWVRIRVVARMGDDAPSERFIDRTITYY